MDLYQWAILEQRLDKIEELLTELLQTKRNIKKGVSSNIQEREE